MGFYGIGESKCDSMIREIEHSDRYPKNSVVKDSRFVRVREDVFQDYFENRRILHSIGGKYLPPFEEG